MQDFTLGLSLSQIEETHWAKESRKVVSAKGTEMLLVWCNRDKNRTRYYKSIFGYLQRYFLRDEIEMQRTPEKKTQYSTWVKMKELQWLKRKQGSQWCAAWHMHQRLKAVSIPGETFGTNNLGEIGRDNSTHVFKIRCLHSDKCTSKVLKQLTIYT